MRVNFWCKHFYNTVFRNIKVNHITEMKKHKLFAETTVLKSIMEISKFEKKKQNRNLTSVILCIYYKDVLIYYS